MRGKTRSAARAGGGSARRRAPWIRAAVLLAFAAALLAAGAAVGPAPAHADGVAHEPIGIIVTGDLVQAPATMQTYSGQAYWLSLAELAGIKADKGAVGTPHAGLWTTAKYSICDDHGVAHHIWATAAGISLRALLRGAGLAESEIDGLSAVKVASAIDPLWIALDLTQSRYLFVSESAGAGPAVGAMLALYENVVDEDGGGYAALPDEATVAVNCDYTKLMLGQLTWAESNQCSYVKGASLIALPEASTAFLLDAPDAKSSDPTERQKARLALADLVARGNTARDYAAGGETYTCHGLDLHTLLSEALGKICPQDRLIVTTKDGAGTQSQELVVPVSGVTAGSYLLAYYSEDAGGTMVENGTQVMLYGEDEAIADVLSLKIEHVAATAALRLTSPTVSQSKATVQKGKRLALRAVTTLAEGAAKGDPVKWKSNSTKVATVAKDGTVTARRAGSAVITATSGACSRKFTVKVVARKVNASRISLAKTKTLYAGATARLSARLSPASATVTVTWRSSNPKVVKVDRGGTVTAVKKGKATITVKTSNGKTARCVVTVKAVI